MKIKFDQENKKRLLYALIVVVIGVALYFFFDKFTSVQKIFNQFTSLLSPFMIGFAIAFLLNHPMMFIENKVLGKLAVSKGIKRSIASVLAILLGICAVILVAAMLLPQLIESIVSLVNSFPQYLQDFQTLVLNIMEKEGINSDSIIDYLGNSGLFSNITNYVTDLIPQMINYTYRFGSTIIDLFVALISALYMLIDKERLMGYVKKSCYALLSLEYAKYLHRMVLKSAEIFNNFIIGKAIDSTIIGILCYIGCSLLSLPYSLLISVFVGITNMIPVFGPFIGAIPGIFIMLIINPWDALTFAIFVIVLQQFDGNILGPIILGDKLGLPSIGILFSVCIGGGIFGIVGMFIGVPVFAIIYYAYREWINYRLETKNIDIETISYD